MKHKKDDDAEQEAGGEATEESKQTANFSGYRQLSPGAKTSQII